MQKNSQIIVSVVIPILNEEKYIEKCIASLLKQDYPREHLEVLLVDGDSDDRTVELITKYQEKYPFIKLLRNPKKTVQHALNIGIRGAVGTYIVRMDAHAEYASDYISKCIYYLENTDADNVGGPMIAKGKTVVQTAVAAAYHSPFALGGGKFHIEGYEGYADTVFLGAFKREFLLSLGLYDSNLPRSEDDDLNFRITENGGKIYITPEIKSVYYPRSSYISLFKQHFEYGVWKVAVIKKHKRPARISHLVPMLFIAFLLFGSILSVFFKPIRCMFLSVCALYLLLDLIFSFKSAYLSRITDKLRLMYIHFVLHVSYGLGFWAGIFKFLVFKNGKEA